MARILVTGANRGIGLALVQLLRKRGDEVIAVCRKSSPALEKTGAEVHAGVDVADQASIERLAAVLKDKPIDILVNNAGIATFDNLETFDFDRARQQFEVNTLGPLRVTRALLPLLTNGAKVAIITSRSGSIGDNGSGGMYGYRMSKAAVNIAGVNLAIELKPKGIAVALLHPGMVKTDMSGGGSGAIAPELSAERLIARLDGMSLATTGKFLHAEGYELPW
jgi:NAD(P)-dependent dehydrogenase (short-subunit alcohol dehydrogenase family)